MDFDSALTAHCDTDQAAELVLRHTASASDVAAEHDYFDATRQLDDTQFDDLLNHFNPDNQMQELLSPNWPSENDPKRDSSAPIESVEVAMNGISPSSSTSNASAMQQYNGLPSANGPSAYGPPTTTRGGLPPSAFQHHNTVQQSMAIQYYSQQYSNSHIYPPPTPTAPPPMAIPNGYYVDTPVQYNNYNSTPYYTPSRQGTEDLLDDVQEEGEDGGAEASDPCYAQLLFRCLRDAPENTLSLKSLYDWIQQNSQKARDSTSKGWQNSVRHNLSMNAAFERVTGANATASSASKKGSLWRLTASALANGVISTTRYRKDPKRKPERRSSPALKRQISGAKGGQATRAATAHRRAVLARTNNRAAASGYNVHNGLDRHRQQALRHDFPPTSMPNSASASASPGFLPLHMSPTGHASGPPSPYLPVQHVESPPWTHVQNMTFSNPNTPTEVQVGAYRDPSKGVLGNFELAAFPGYLFADRNEMGSPVTPGMESFYSDDHSAGTGERATSEGVYT